MLTLVLAATFGVAACDAGLGPSCELDDLGYQPWYRTERSSADLSSSQRAWYRSA
jgi:hypothetical protein